MTRLKVKQLKALTVILVFLATGLTANAADGSSRSSKKIGVVFSVLSAPFPNLTGGTLNYHVLSFLSVYGGYGSISAGGFSASVYGGGARLFVPTFNLSPFVGFGYSSVTATGPVTIGSATINASGGLGVLSTRIGLDWQTNFGLDLGFEYTIGMTSPLNIAIPGFFIGWYF